MRRQPPRFLSEAIVRCEAMPYLSARGPFRGLRVPQRLAIPSTTSIRRALLAEAWRVPRGRDGHRIASWHRKESLCTPILRYDPELLVLACLLMTHLPARGTSC